jgi:predicted nuclease of predicted toxin-antitoxin system
MDASTKFLIDECLSPKLACIAQDEFGFEARHVPWLGKPPRGQNAWKDPDIVTKVAEGDFVLVTNNRRDFVGKYYREAGVDVHNGLVIILRKSDLDGEMRLFRLVMKHIVALESTVNKLVEIDADGVVRVAEWPDHSLDQPFGDPFK